MQLLVEDGEIRRVVGGGAYTRGLAYARGGRVLARRWDDDASTLSGRVCGTARSAYATEARLRPMADGALRIVSTSCTCPVGSGCKHAAALLLQARGELASHPRAADTGDDATRAAALKAPGRTGAGAPSPEWRRTLDAALNRQQAPSRGSLLGLQLELVAAREGSARDLASPYRVSARPVVLSAAGRWVRTGITWSQLSLGYSYGHNERHVAALSALQAVLAADGRDRYSRYYNAGSLLYLDGATGSGLWGVLDDVRRAGVALVHSRADGAPVAVLETPATVLVDLSRDGNGITATPTILLDGEPLASARLGLIGGADPIGVYWWSAEDDRDSRLKNRRLTLARFAEPLSAEVTSLLDAGHALQVPTGHVEQFLDAYYPRLAARMPVGSRDGSVELPDPPHPVLQLTVRVGESHALDLDWAWEYRAPDGTTVERVPLRPEPGERSWRSPADEASVLARVTGSGGVIDAATAAGRRALFEPGPDAGRGADGPLRLAERCRLGHWETVELVTSVLPALRALPDVEVVVVGDLADYRQAEHEARIAVTTSASAGTADDAGVPVVQDRDWFDLAITVHVEDQPVPLAPLLRALAAGEDRLLLPDGLWLRIDTPALAGLRSLIEEARALQDSPAGPLRISRFQAGMWDELEALGVVVEQAQAWREAVAGLRRLEALPDDVLVPDSVHAELRPYQQEGFGWLVRLGEAGLGGVLADDMGLGKTLQVLALAARLRLERPTADASPLLVVAPTSVVGGWAAEAARFVPDLRVRTIDRTRRKRGAELADLAADADVVVTSYALFRIEFDDYAALGWSVLVLDEAQMVKNHESVTYACAKRLRAPVKLAITGTPLENTVMELWALLGLVAPGLFPSPRRFTEFYRAPIEREGDGDRLALLRRRIRPLVLRRTKEQVASDLPPRIENVVEVELSARHRAVYDRHLHRERQKVLGLLDDFSGNRFEIFRSLMLLRRLSLDPGLVDPAYAGVPATKLDVLDDMLEEIVADGHRVLVFSQFTGVLDRVRTRLDTRGTAYSYLDGSTRRRAQVIDRFRSGDAPVFLISLKAGGFGLTLTEADYVVVLDPWWNPAVEAQAVDRVHRIGQLRTVMVYRLVATGTIEEKVMALKEGKARLFDSVMGGGELADARLSAADVRALLE